MISGRRLLITSTQPQLGNNSEHPSVGKGGKQRREKDGMTECRKGWEDSRERQTHQSREGKIWNV